MGELRRTKLRAKTGCLTCRTRRKKCDEAYPACHNCTQSLRRCQWPTSDELIDRRHASHRSRQSSSPNPTTDSDGGSPFSTASSNGNNSSDTRAIRKPSMADTTTAIATTNLCRLSEATAHRLICHDLEPVIRRHFAENYYELLILPNCSPEFFYGWIADIQKLMVQYKSLEYSVLACGASHLHFVDASSMMQELSLTYYSNSIKGLSELLGELSELENDNGVLMSVILLYLHGCMGRGTYSDIPRHLNAAMRIVRLRLLERPWSLSRPFDRLAVESVLYQIFLVATGSWTDPRQMDHHFDHDFWLEAEQLLAKSNLYPGRSISFNSPVIGVPLALFRVVLSLKRLYQNPSQHDHDALEALRSEVEKWEGVVLSEGEIDSPDEYQNCNPGIYRDAGYLYILVSSLLMDQISVGDWIPGAPMVAPPDSWQLKKAKEILRGRQDDIEWARCFIGNWPVYSLGFFLDEPDIELIRADLHHRWMAVKFSQISRFRDDLETTWAARGYGFSPSACFESLAVITPTWLRRSWMDLED